jgi:hypothetical protein
MKKKEKKTFDAVAFMRKRRAELSRAYAGLSAEPIEEKVQQALKNDPLWQRHRRTRSSSSSEKKTGGYPQRFPRVGRFAPAFLGVRSPLRRRPILI